MLVIVCRPTTILQLAQVPCKYIVRWAWKPRLSRFGRTRYCKLLHTCAVANMQTCHCPQQQLLRLPRLSGVSAALQPCRPFSLRISPAASPVCCPGLHTQTGRHGRKRSSIMCCL
jgi:hypothetical protein